MKKCIMKKILFLLAIAGSVLITSCEDIMIENPINENHLELIFNLRIVIPQGCQVSMISLGIAREVDGQVDPKSVQYFVNPKPGFNKLILEENAASNLIGKPGVYFFLTICVKNKNGDDVLICNEFIETNKPLKIGPNRFEHTAQSSSM